MDNPTIDMSKQDKAPQENTSQENPVNQWLRIAAYPISMVAGYLFARPGIRNAAHEKLKGRGAFDDIYPAHNKKLRDIHTRFLAGQPINVIEETAAAENAYKALLVKRYEKMGLGTTYEQLKYLHRGQRNEVLMNGIGAAAVTLGVLLVLADGKALSFLFKNSESKQQTPER